MYKFLPPSDLKWPSLLVRPPSLHNFSHVLCLFQNTYSIPENSSITMAFLVVMITRNLWQGKGDRYFQIWENRPCKCNYWHCRRHCLGTWCREFTFTPRCFAILQGIQWRDAVANPPTR